MKGKMICPDCGIEMNHHADKVDYNIRKEDRVDPGMGGAVEEVHTCPDCGKTHTRREEVG